MELDIWTVPRFALRPLGDVTATWHATQFAAAIAGLVIIPLVARGLLGAPRRYDHPASDLAALSKGNPMHRPTRVPVAAASVFTGALGIGVVLTACGDSAVETATATPDSTPVVDGEQVAVSTTIDVTAGQAADTANDGDGASINHDPDTADDGLTDRESGSPAELDIAPGGADAVIEIDIVDGSVRRDDTRFVVEEGSTVALIVSSDAPDHVHVHGYDILATIGPGDPVELVFTADSPGLFEVELEDAGLFLFDLQVG